MMTSDASSRSLATSAIELAGEALHDALASDCSPQPPLLSSPAAGDLDFLLEEAVADPDACALQDVFCALPEEVQGVDGLEGLEGTLLGPSSPLDMWVEDISSALDGQQNGGPPSGGATTTQNGGATTADGCFCVCCDRCVLCPGFPA